MGSSGRATTMKKITPGNQRKTSTAKIKLWILKRPIKRIRMRKNPRRLKNQRTKKGIRRESRKTLENLGEAKQRRKRRKRRMKTNRGDLPGGLQLNGLLGPPMTPENSSFLIKWKGSDEADLVTAKEANVKIPQIVIKFYEERLNWYDTKEGED